MDIMQNELLSTRGNVKYVHEGFTYTFDKLSICQQKKYWRCSRKSDMCKARLHTCRRTGEVLRKLNEHNHGSDPAIIGGDRVKNAIKRRAANTVETPAQVISNSLAGTSGAVQGQLPNKAALQKIVQRKRRATHVVPPSPTDLTELILPDSYKQYVVSPDRTILFLLGDTGNVKDRILLFGREDGQEWSGFMKNLYVDGTFTLAPSLFAQVFAILVEREGFVFPVLYALLPNKQQQTYSRLFALIKSVWPNLQPDSISTDYEMAILNSIAEEFPTAEIRGCLFHLSKNIKKQLGKCHLLSQYNNDADYALKARMIVSLAFVPVEKLCDVVAELYRHLPVTLQKVLEWFEDNYIGHVSRDGTRSPAMFDPNIWSVYERVLSGQNRTNNYAEAAHRSLQRELDVQYPSLWKFIDGLKKIQKTRDAHYAGFLKGDQPPYKRRKYQMADARIAENVRKFNSRTTIEYLTGIAQNFLLN